MYTQGTSVWAPTVAFSVADKNGHEISVTNLAADDRVVIVFAREQRRNTGHNCSYWDVTDSVVSTEGCAFNSRLSNETHAVCECSHMTEFVLVDNILAWVDLEFDPQVYPTLPYPTLPYPILLYCTTWDRSRV